MKNNNSKLHVFFVMSAGFMGCSLSSIEVLAEQNTRIYKSDERESKKREKKFEVSAGFQVPTKLTDMPKEELKSLRGINLDLARTFSLGGSWHTVSNGSISVISGQVQESDWDFKGRQSFVALALRQSITTHQKLGTTILKPFVDLGVGRGEYEYSGKTDDVNVSVKGGYTQIMAGLGLRHQVTDQLTWFIRYDFGRAIFDKKMKVSASVDSKTVSSEESIGSYSDRKFNTQVATAGLGFLF